jgi:hypothetical protein
VKVYDVQSFDINKTFPWDGDNSISIPAKINGNHATYIITHVLKSLKRSLV